MQNWSHDFCASFKNSRWDQVKADCAIFVQACKCLPRRFYNWQAAEEYRMHVSYFEVRVVLCINYDVSCFESANEAVRLFPVSRIHSVPCFKAGIFDTRCFLSVSLLAFDHQLFDEGLASAKFDRIFPTKS